MQPYPKTIAETVKSVTDFCKVISRYRDEDITDRNKFNSIYFLSRKVGRVPSGSADVIAGDKVGDINYTVDYLYILVDDGMGGAWRRSALSSW